MNILRPTLRACLKRSYSTQTFIPPAALRDIERKRWESLPRPDSPTFYTARPQYYDQLNSLESAIQHSRKALTTYQLLPLPEFARKSLPQIIPVWMDKREMTAALEAQLTTSRYRRMIQLLNELNQHLLIARMAGCDDLANGLQDVVQIFEKTNQDAIRARGQRKPVEFDEYGRSYTVGKRKTSAARVWIIPIQQQEPATTDQPQSTPTPASSFELEDLFRDPSTSKPTIAVTAASVLVNNVPLSTYFPVPADRERVIRPLKLTGLLGAYNVFTLVRGGGTSGQAGAIAHGIAKGLAAHDPSVEPILRKSKLTRRDPRMVERKKTGLAKARKRYTWVKR
ncbi:ribosomal protein S9/S16-domain-containing protein [Hygrophoropsis aurantiaca]|uniref:Ribosomal protein S9/S16-domain-containing protein n=1 Tax=Hygrophoropsis aurantiaca TaxID=72124 RepID=A0ACB8AG81_9AGAM|nr:ribosomal protein S9/S16-domain-containing protein [Hygrophoropsis aurantiaca]